MGIIDYLTRYGKKKIFENMVRSLFNDSNGISCVKPSKYKERFLSSEELEKVEIVPEESLEEKEVIDVKEI